MLWRVELGDRVGSGGGQALASGWTMIGAGEAGSAGEKRRLVDERQNQAVVAKVHRPLNWDGQLVYCTRHTYSVLLLVADRAQSTQ